MKANINGIQFEGTPEEIIKYQQLVSEQKNSYFDQFKGLSSDVDVEKLSKELEKFTKQKPTIIGYY